MTEIVRFEDYKPGDGDDGHDRRPVIRVHAGKIAEAVTAIDEAFKENPAGLFQQGGRIVHVIQTPVATADGGQTTVLRLTDAAPAHVGEAMTRVARVEKFDGRKGDFVATHAPSLLIDTYLQRKTWLLPYLRAVVGAPTLRPDGSVLQRSGYDPSTALLLVAEEQFPPVAENPSIEDAAEAFQFLNAPFDTFDFIAPADRSVFIAGILTAVARGALDAAPMFGVTAPVAGSGKSMLVDCVALIATGRRAPVLSQGHTEEEFEKRLHAALLGGDGFICVDNCEASIESALLCQVLTQSEVKIRPLGASAMLDVPTNSTCFATGNNLTVRGDLTRRMLMCRLDPLTERPELREFAGNPLDLIAADRGKYVAAALTILRGRHVSGWQSPKPPIGSFAAWSRVVRDSLLWIGAADPCEALEQMRDRDPKLAALTALLDEWEGAIGEEPMQLSRVIDRATETAAGEYHYPALREALLTVAGDKGTINPVRLGRWMAANAERIVAGRRFVKDGARSGIARWKLEIVER